MNTFPLDRIQHAIQSENVDGWLLYDFQGSDVIAKRLLQISETVHLTRRWFYWIPAKGVPKKLMHRIEPASLAHLPGDAHYFSAWKELESELAQLLRFSKVIAMNYSPRNAIPYVSRVDAGTLELVKSQGVNVVSAADLISLFESTWTSAQLESHIRAAKHLRTIVDETFSFVAREVGRGKLTEFDVQQFIWDRFVSLHLTTDSRPIAAVGPNSGNPHYEPTAKVHLPVKPGDFLLIDLWAKEETGDSVYADITWTGFIGKTIPEKYETIFQIVRKGRDAALQTVEEAVANRTPLQGAMVDDAARNAISQSGYGEYFIHRTGHSIGRNVHGNGANMDNFETREERKILPNTCFSIEPGIYLKEFGVRSEIDVFVSESNVQVYGLPMQTSVVSIF